MVDPVRDGDEGVLLGPFVGEFDGEDVTGLCVCPLVNGDSVGDVEGEEVVGWIV